MRVIKSLLLGAAAGLVATAGAQAADLPVKAKPVEYVKICSAYGAGFYFIPGTDICLRVGGYVYYEFGVKGSAAVPDIYNTGAINSSKNYYNTRTSARVNLDARQNTAYGTLRAYMSTGGNFNLNHVNVTSWDAAFIQFAGFTWGYTNSFYSFAYAGYGVTASAMTDWSWINLFAYTAQLGNGLTASISIEDPQGRRAFASGAGGNLYGGRWLPDIVGNINVTQAWGRAQVMGAIHQVKPAAALVPLADSEYGFAVGAGIELKTPQTGNPNNSFIVEASYTEGAVDYTGYNSSPTAAAPATAAAAGGTTLGIGKFIAAPVFLVRDFTLNAAGGLNLTEAWNVYAGYRHYWTPMLRTAFAAGYLEIDEGVTPTSQGKAKLTQAGIYNVWSPVNGLDLSLDVVWTDLEVTSVAGVQTSNDIITVWSRLRRNF